MGVLGDKQYNYNYYGLPDRSRVWGTAGYGGYAALTYLNIWGSYLPPPISAFETDGVYWSHDGQTSDNNGKPLDDTIALWNINKNTSFATNCMFSVNKSDTLTVNYAVNLNNSDVPLLCCAVDTDSGVFSRRPWERYADDISYPCNGTFSAPVFDIVYNNFCLSSSVYVYNRTTNVQTILSLDAIASTITNRDFIDLMFIRPTVWRAATTPRFSTAEYIPPQGLHTTKQGVILFDSSAYKPIVDSETGLKNLIADTAGGHSYDSTRVYNPFSTQYQQIISNSTGTNSISFQMQIGFTRTLTKSNIVSGYTTIATGERMTGQFYRCNYNIKSFSDVVYQWEDVIFDTVNLIELQNGADISSYANSDTFRLYTRLHIIDRKNNSYGKALELAVKHELAYIGLYFTDNDTLGANAELGTAATGVYLPLYTGGVPNGEYVTGDDIPLQPHATANSVSDDTFKYRPEETNSDSGDLTTHLHSDTMGGSTRYYALDDLDVYFVSQWLNTSYKPDTAQLSEDFKGVNPSDYIVSLRYYPFDVPYSNTAETLSIGGIPVEVSGNTVSVDIHNREYGTNSNSYFDLGSFVMQPPYVYGDFRDTYLKVLLYIPWCGLTTLDSSLFTQSPDGTYHTISAGISIDFATGTALGMIYRDGILIDTVSGTVGVDVPMSAVANGSYQNAIKQTEIALKNAKAQQLTAYLSAAGAVVGGVVSATTGNIAGVGASAAAFAGAAIKTEQINNTIENLQYQLTHTAPAIGDISSASPFNNALSEQTARIFIFKPVMLPGADIDAYAQTTGHACCKQGILSDISRGYTECAGADMSGIECTATEKSMIFSALKSGVIV